MYIMILFKLQDTTGFSDFYSPSIGVSFVRAIFLNGTPNFNSSLGFDPCMTTPVIRPPRDLKVVSVHIKREVPQSTWYVLLFECTELTECYSGWENHQIKNGMYICNREIPSCLSSLLKYFPTPWNKSPGMHAWLLIQYYNPRPVEFFLPSILSSYL